MERLKVVLFCGGLGLRLREGSESLPKPLAQIGARPVIWHLMKYYAHYGHNDFVLCLGFQGEAIKKYFLAYEETLSNNFVLKNGGRSVELLNRDIDDWTIRFIDTGLRSNVGQRLKAVRNYVEGDELFLANYADGVSDLPLDRYIDHFRSRDEIACFVSVRPSAAFHLVDVDAEGVVQRIVGVRDSDMRINGGFFIFRPQIFDYIEDGEELVEEPFGRLIAERKILAYRYDGFWQCLDTFKDRQALEDLEAQDSAPWQVWDRPAPRQSHA